MTQSFSQMDTRWSYGNLRQASVTSRLLAWLFVLSFAFDVKGGQGGSIAQFAMAAVNVGAFLLLALRVRGVLPHRGGAAFILWAWCALLIAGSLSAAIYSVPFYRFIRAFFPFFLFAEGFLVAWWLGRDYAGAAVLTAAMTAAAVISLFFTFWWGFHFTGRAATHIRYQILSPLIPYLIVVAGFDLMFLRRHRFMSFCLLTIAFCAIGLSITRSMLVIISAVVVVIMVAIVLRWLAGRLLVPRPVLRTAVGGLGMGGLALLGALVAAPDVISRWITRALGPHSSITLWTRVAAVVQQWTQVMEHPAAWFVGRGFGQTYHYATSFAPMLVPYVPAERFFQDVWFPAEFMWIAPVYYGGVIVGPLAIAALVWGGVFAFKSVVRVAGENSWGDMAQRPLLVGALGYFAFLAMGFASDPFIIRLAAMFMGLTLGLVMSRAGRRGCE